MTQPIDGYLHRYYEDFRYNCAETVLNAANDAWNIGLEPRALRMMGGFGGGMGCKNVCGAISGGIAAMSALLTEESGHQSPYLMQKVRTYMELVKSRMGDEHCEFLKPRFWTPEQSCFPTVEKIAAILEEVMNAPCDLPRRLPKVMRSFELSRQLRNPAYVVIDAREGDAFEGQAGRLPGAVNLRSECLGADAKSFLAGKGILPEKNLVLYGDSMREIARLADLLCEKGYGNLFFFDWTQWDGEREMGG